MKLFRTLLVSGLVCILIAITTLYLLRLTGPAKNYLLLGIDAHAFRQPFQSDINIVFRQRSAEPNQIISLPRALMFRREPSRPGARTVFPLNKFPYLENNQISYEDFKKLPVEARSLGVTRGLLEDLLGLPIHGYIMIDSQGFIDAVDAIGGIAVSVPFGFKEYQYLYEDEQQKCENLAQGLPAAPCHRTFIEFKPGMQEMDGARALAFIRSRRSAEQPGATRREARSLLIIDAINRRVREAPYRVPFLLWAIVSQVRADLSFRSWLSLGSQILFNPQKPSFIAVGSVLAAANGDTNAGLIFVNESVKADIQNILR